MKKNRHRGRGGGQQQQQEEVEEGGELARLRKQNDELQKQLSELLNELRELKKAQAGVGKGGDKGASGKEATPGKGKSVEGEGKGAQKPKGGDSLDAEWEVVVRGKQKPPAPKSSIFGSTALPPQRAGGVDEEASPSAAAEGEEWTPQEDGSDPRDWSVPIRPCSGAVDRMKVGRLGVCLADSPSEITALLHDMQATDQPAAMLTYEKVEGAQLAPVRVWKKGKPVLKRLWMTHLGTGENGQVRYIGHVAEEEDFMAEEWEETLSL